MRLGAPRGLLGCPAPWQQAALGGCDVGWGGCLLPTHSLLALCQGWLVSTLQGWCWPPGWDQQAGARQGWQREETLPTTMSRREWGQCGGPVSLLCGGACNRRGGPGWWCCVGTLGLPGAQQGWALGCPTSTPAPGPTLTHTCLPRAHCIILLLESLFFGAFVTIVFYDQVSGAEVVARSTGTSRGWGGCTGMSRGGCVLAVTTPSPPGHVDHHGQDAPRAAPQSGVEGDEPGGATSPETQTGAAAGGVWARCVGLGSFVGLGPGIPAWFMPLPFPLARFRALLALPLELQHRPRHGSHVQPPAQPLCLSSLYLARERMLETHR